MTGKATKIVVVGAGFAGLECASLLRWRLPDAHVTLVSEDDRFIHRPSAIYVPFGLNPDKVVRRVGPSAAKRKIEFVARRVEEIDPYAKTVRMSGRKIRYDYLVLATGAGRRPHEIKRLADHAINLWTIGDMMRLRQALRLLRAEADRGKHSEVVFVAAPGNFCTMPLYETAFMFETWAQRAGIRGLVCIRFATFEQEFCEALGPGMHDRLAAEFEQRDIEARTAIEPHRVESDGLLLRDGRDWPFDLLVAAPPHVGSARFASLPADERGFFSTDEVTCAVQGHPDVFAIGDCGSFPAKQSFLAIEQADVVAENIAAEVSGEYPPAGFVADGLYVMERAESAMYVQAPLRATGGRSSLRADTSYPYRIGTSGMWHFGRRLLARLTMSRLGHVRPLRAGVLWDVAELGLRATAQLFSQQMPVEEVEGPEGIELTDEERLAA